METFKSQEQHSDPLPSIHATKALYLLVSSLGDVWCLDGQEVHQSANVSCTHSTNFKRQY